MGVLGDLVETKIENILFYSQKYNDSLNFFSHEHSFLAQKKEAMNNF
jgi:hypothetical protein